MSDLLSDILSNVPVIGSLFEQEQEPIYPRRPDALTAVIRKYTENDFSQFDPVAVRSAVELDLERANRGSMPFSLQETIAGLYSLETSQPFYKEPERRPQDLPLNIIRDIKDITMSIPRIPTAIGNEVLSITRFPEEFRKIQEQPGGNFLSDILSAPGVRMLPGAYVGANIAKGDINEVLTHPVMSTLDVLPLIKTAKVGSLVKNLKPYNSFRQYIDDWMLRSKLGHYAWQITGKGREEFLRMTSPIPIENIFKDPVQALKDYPDTKLAEYIKSAIKHKEVIESRPEFMAIISDPEHMKRLTLDAVQGRWNNLTPLEKEFVAEFEALNTMQSYLVSLLDNSLVVTAKDPFKMKIPGLKFVFDGEGKFWRIMADSPETIYNLTKEAFLNNQLPPFEVFTVKQAQRLALIKMNYDRDWIYRMGMNLLYKFESGGRLGQTAVFRNTPANLNDLEFLWAGMKEASLSFESMFQYHKRRIPTEITEAYKAVVLAAGRLGADISMFFNKRTLNWRTDMLHRQIIDVFVNDFVKKAKSPNFTVPSENILWNYNEILNALQPYKHLRYGGLAYDAVKAIGSHAFKPGTERIYDNAISAIRLFKDKTKKVDRRLFSTAIQYLGYQKEAANWGGGQALLNKGTKFNDVNRQIMVQKAVRKITPARYTDYLTQELVQRVYESYDYIQRTANVFTPEEWEKIAEYALNGQFSALATFDHLFKERGVTTQQFANAAYPWAPKRTATNYVLSLSRIKSSFRSDLQKALSNIMDKGEPVAFVHHVSPRQVEALDMRRLLEFNPTPSQIRDRVVDVTPWVKDMQIALTHKNYELIFNSYYDEMLRKLVDPDDWLASHIKTRMDDFGNVHGAIPDEFRSPVAKTRNQIVRELEPIFNRLWEKGRFHPSMTREDAFASFIEQRYEKWDPESMITFRTSRIPSRKRAVLRMQNNQPVLVDFPDIYLPKPFAKALRDLARQPVSKVWDPVMNVFRYAVLPFSPRFYINNIIGGAILGMLDQGPLNFGKALLQANELLKKSEVFDPELGYKIKSTLDFRNSLGQIHLLSEQFRTVRGQSIAAWFADQLGLSPDKVLKVSKNADILRDRFDRLVDFCFRFNQVTDDLYRAAVFISEHKRIAKQMVRSGMDITAAYDEIGKQAVRAVRRTLHSLDSLSPLERIVMRNVIPFYAFLSHILKFAFKFPIDHPVRASVIASLAEIELMDMQLFPDKFLSFIPLPFLSDDDEEAFINMIGANPFSNVADMLTFQGFAGTLNPIIATIAEQLGIDLFQGGPSRDPWTGWDEITGRQDWKPTGLIPTFLTNIIPQANLPLALIGANENFNDLARSDPEAARQFLLSSIGIPQLYKKVNMDQEVLKLQHYARQHMRQTLTEALKSGRYRAAEQRYPQLKPIFDQLRQLSSDQLPPASIPDLVTAQEALSSIITRENAFQDLREAAEVLAPGG